MPKKKADAKTTVQKAFPDSDVSVGLPVHSAPARPGLSRASASAKKLAPAALATQPLKKSTVTRCEVGPKKPSGADTLFVRKSVFADGDKIVAYEG